MKQDTAIRVGDKFKSRSGVIWEVFEDLKFGRGYWVVTIPDRERQTIMKRAMLERHERVTS
jgi:hypothetical protein